MTRLAILLGFQLAWFATAFSVTAKRPLLGAIMSGAVCGAHFLFRRHRTRLAALVAASGAIGYAADTLLESAGLLSFEVAAPSTPGSPLWMVLLWVNFAVTVDAMPAWITARVAVAAAAGAIGGPLSYIAGEKFDALVLLAPRPLSIAAVAVEWAIAMPLLVWLERSLIPKPRPGVLESVVAE